MGYTKEYNREAAGKAWEIIGYTHSGAVCCPDCADSRYSRARLMGQGDGVYDNPAPIFAVGDVHSPRDCERCGAVISLG